MKDDIRDVIVIGGGPAGSTAAAYLAMQGLDVVLLEKEKFPREHVGESLLPFNYEILKELGVLDKMIKNYVRKPGARFTSYDGTQQATWCFNRVIKDETHLAFQVVRAKFDTMLLDNARAKGAAVFEETMVKSVNLEAPDNQVEINATTKDGETKKITAKFLIDASGQSTFLAKRLGGKKSIEDMDRVAFYSHWDDVTFVSGAKEGLIEIVLLDGTKKGWIWLIPLSKKRVSVGVVLNNQYVKAQKKQLENAGEEDWKVALYKQELLSSPFVEKALATGHISQPLVTYGNYSYSCDQKFGKNFAVIGDAAGFLDPIFSTGVYMAMNCGRLLGRNLGDILGKDAGERLSALNDMYTDINGAYALIDKLIRLYYDPAIIHFNELGVEFRDHYKQQELVYSIIEYIFVGDFFEKYETYLQYLNHLENPDILKKFKSFYLEHPDLKPTKSCHTNDAIIFPDTI